MKINLLSMAALVAFSSIATLAHADPRITEVTNDTQATNGCTISRVYGYSGYNFVTIIFGVDCPSEPRIVYTEKKITNYSWGGQDCEMRSSTTGYYTAGVCGDYSVYKID